MKKQHLPEKICIHCLRPFTWRKKGTAAGRKYNIVLNDVNVSPDGNQNQTLRNACIGVNNRPVSHQVNAAADAWFFGLSHVHATF